MLPDYEEEVEVEESTEKGQDVLFDFEKGDIALYDGQMTLAEGKEALLQWMAKLLLTECEKYEIYTEYGVPLKKIMFSDTPELFKEAELQEEITDKLLENDSIYDVEEFEFSGAGPNKKAIISMETEFGTISEEMFINGTN